MFNLKEAKEKTRTFGPQEKQLERQRKDLSNQADEGPGVWEKSLITEHKPDDEVTTEKQMEREHITGRKVRDGAEEKILEKKMDQAKDDKYYPLRNTRIGELSVPPIQALVEKMRQERLTEYTDKQKKDKNWTNKRPTQNAGLPKWPKTRDQHDKPVLNNDPQRFERLKNLPTSADQTKNDDNRLKSNEIEPLVGKISNVQLDVLALGIKSGRTLSEDEKILNILKQADGENRELTADDKNQIVEFKLARNEALLGEKTG